MKTHLLVMATAVAVSPLLFLTTAAADCSSGSCNVKEKCSTDRDCGTGLHCFSCKDIGFIGSRCVRAKANNPFRIQNNSLPFNKYAYLTTHNSFAIKGSHFRTGLIPRVTVSTQEDSVTDQLNNGVRALMLDVYDFKGDIWLCHSYGGICKDLTAFGRAIDTLKEVEAFMRANPSEIVTLILEDYVETPQGLTKLFNAAGLVKYWFPVSKMPKNGEDWPIVRDMVANNQRLLVFTSKGSKEAAEGIAYQWNYMVENKYGNKGMVPKSCENRAESSALNDKTKSLIFMNHFGSVPLNRIGCLEESEDLPKMLQTCHQAAGDRWANFLAVDFYKRSQGGGAFDAVDKLNGELLCGRPDVTQCPMRID